MKTTSALEWLNRDQAPADACSRCAAIAEEVEHGVKSHARDPFDVVTNLRSPYYGPWSELKSHARDVAHWYQREGWTVYYRPLRIFDIRFRFYVGIVPFSTRIWLKLAGWRGGRR